MGLDEKYTYERFGTKGARVGQAVVDILDTKQDERYTAEDIIEGFSKDYLDWIREIADVHAKEWGPQFYIYTLMSKVLGQFGVANALQNNFRVRKTAPRKDTCMELHPNHTKTLFKANSNTGTIDLVWTLPGKEECISILKKPELYDSELVSSIMEVVGGKKGSSNCQLHEIS